MGPGTPGYPDVPGHDIFGPGYAGIYNPSSSSFFKEEEPSLSFEEPWISTVKRRARVQMR